jgi:MFS family permease
MQSVAHGWLVLTLTDSPFWVGLVQSLGTLPILLFTIYGGVVADRVDKHRFIILLQGAMLLESLALAVLTWTGYVTVPWVIVLAVFFGLLAAFEVPARQSFVVEMVGRGDLTNAIALNSTAFNVSRMIGPALAGALIATAGVAACFLANSASFVAVIIGLLAMRWPGGRPRVAGLGAGASLGEGARYLAGEPSSRALMLFVACLSIFGYPFIAMLPVFARDALGAGASGYGGLLSSVGVGAAVGAIGLAAIGRQGGQARAALASGALFGACLAGAAAVPSFPAAAAILVGAGSSMAIASINANSYLQRSAPDHLRGRVMGFYSFAALGLAPVGTLQAGWVAEHFGVRSSLAVGGLVCATASLVLGGIVGRGPDPSAARDRA